MKTSVQHPLALFDTLDYLSQSIAPCVQSLLATLTVTQREQITKEYSLSREFLLSYAGSLDTFNAYRREVERLLHWTWWHQHKTLFILDRNDIRQYLEFNDNPPMAWRGQKIVSRFLNRSGQRVHNTEWRPYVCKISKAQRLHGSSVDKQHYQLSNKSRQALLATLSSFFSYLQQEEYLTVNPISLLRQKNRYLQRTQQHRITRKLSRTQWLYVINTAEDLAQQNIKHERTLFLMSAFYLLGLRISELAETPGRIPKMSDFSPDKHDRWWFSTVGKGNKLREVAVPDAMLTALKRYRSVLNLPPLPHRSEETPLLHKQRGQGGLGPRQIRNLVQYCFDHAIYRLQQDQQQDAAYDLSAATVHWLRHTAISADIEHRPREHVRDDVGHGSAATTEQYIDADLDARYQSAKSKPLKPNGSHNAHE